MNTPKKEKESIVHIAGLVITLTCRHGHKRILQRCGICGEKLIDIVNSDPTLELGAWEPGTFIKSEFDGAVKRTIDVPNGSLPSNICTFLIE